LAVLALDFSQSIDADKVVMPTLSDWNGKQMG
jgi:hypothetical protein